MTFREFIEQVVKSDPESFLGEQYEEMSGLLDLQVELEDDGQSAKIGIYRIIKMKDKFLFCTAVGKEPEMVEFERGCDHSHIEELYWIYRDLQAQQSDDDTDDEEDPPLVRLCWIIRDMMVEIESLKKK